MDDAWRVLARNYARYDTPLKPNAEVVAALRQAVTGDDPLVVVLGSTPSFAQLARRVWFIDAVADALRLVDPAPAQRVIEKDWFDASAEFEAADTVVGDCALNALSSRAAADALLKLLRQSLRPGATLALRTFVTHEFDEAALEDTLADVLRGGRFSALRMLLYGVVADGDGNVRLKDIERWVVEHGGAHRDAYFEWRGLSIDAALAVPTTAFIPTRADFDAMVATAGFSASSVAAGSFAFAELTPIYLLSK